MKAIWDMLQGEARNSVSGSPP